jgi:membrane protein YqaA with SNARE-associated domain
MSNTTTPPTLTVQSLGKALSNVVNWAIGEALDNPRVHKLVSWALVTVGALERHALGSDIALTLVATGGAAHVLTSNKTPAA